MNDQDILSLYLASVILFVLSNDAFGSVGAVPTPTTVRSICLQSHADQDRPKPAPVYCVGIRGDAAPEAPFGMKLAPAHLPAPKEIKVKPLNYVDSGTADTYSGFKYSPVKSWREPFAIPPSEPKPKPEFWDEAEITVEMPKPGKQSVESLYPWKPYEPIRIPAQLLPDGKTAESLFVDGEPMFSPKVPGEPFEGLYPF